MKSATAAAMMTMSAPRLFVVTASCISAAEVTCTPLRPVGYRQRSGGDHSDPSAARGGLGREGVPLAARAAVADEPHRIDGLAGATKH